VAPADKAVETEERRLADYVLLVRGEQVVGVRLGNGRTLLAVPGAGGDASLRADGIEAVVARGRFEAFVSGLTARR
jgi:hypothetical protein